MSRSVVLFVPGLIFGVGLAVGGMTNPAKVVGFLDLAGRWDPSLAFVMIGAVLGFAILNVLVHRLRAPILCGTFPGARATGTIQGRLFVGSGLFGVGWGLGGFCPGPGIANLGRLAPDVFVFVGAMVIGIFAAQWMFGLDRSR